MNKALCFGALGIGALMLLVFLLDLVIKVPFGGGPFQMVDIFGLLASGVVVYLGYNALRDMK